MSARDIEVAVVGCGLIGRRRAEQARAHRRTRLALAVDPVIDAAREVAAGCGARAAVDWRAAVDDDTIDVVVVATPNGFLFEVAAAALRAGKHVLVEKPMGRNLAEARGMAALAHAAGRRFKVGFNHRYHPAIAAAHQRFVAGEIGDLIHVRARYGHGGRPGYEREWRGDRRLAGGGELTDQGVHVIDLVNWFAGAAPDEAFGYLQTAVWPLGDLEDNAFGLLRWDAGPVASFHTAWTQWKNLFSFEVFGTKGALVVEGLGRSYGTETLQVVRRKPEGGVPDVEALTFDGPDESWRLEWEDFVRAIETGAPHLADADEGVSVMATLEALYRSAATGQPARTARDPRRPTPAVFLDRDGVLNEVVERGGRFVSPRTPADFRLVDGVDRAGAALRAAGVPFFVVTNQPDIARGHMRADDLAAMNDVLERTLLPTALRVCPHDDGDGCDCRKPRPGALTALAADFAVDLATSVQIGDTEKDAAAGRAAGVRTILIDRPYNRDVLADHRVPDLISAVELALDLLPKQGA